MSGAAVEVKTERDVNLLTNEPVVRIRARQAGTRRWTRFLVYASPGTSLEYIEDNAQSLGEKLLAGSHD